MESLLNAGRFRKMAARFYSYGLFREDIEFVAAVEWYDYRKHGSTVGRCFQAAKFKAFHTALEYYRLNRRYEAAEYCDCEQCYFGRPSQCLNGVPVVRPQIDEISLDSRLANGQLVIEMIALEVPDKYQDRQWMMSQVALLYESCNDWRDVRIIDGLRQGKTQEEVGSGMNMTQQGTSKRLTAIGERFLLIEQ